MKQSKKEIEKEIEKEKMIIKNGVNSSDSDYNDLTREAILLGLGQVPKVGGLLSGVTGLLWPPNSPDVWDSIKHRVERLVAQRISEALWISLKNDLNGFNANIAEFLTALAHDEPDYRTISSKYDFIEGLFLSKRYHFQSPGHEVFLLPLFAQFANLQLSLLRTGVLFGAQWGKTESSIERIKVLLTETIATYTTYVEQQHSAGATHIFNTHGPEDKFHRRWSAVNNFNRETTLTVLDFKTLWEYFDVTKYPEPVSISQDREIYTEAFGTCSSKEFAAPNSPPKLPITGINVWGHDRLDAMEVRYRDGGGPNDITSTGRMGNKKGGDFFWFNIKDFDGPIRVIEVRSSEIINAMRFYFKKSNHWTDVMGGKYPTGTNHHRGYPGHILSSIKIMGESAYYKCADCAIFGFKLDKPSNQILSKLAQILYVTSVKKMDIHEIEKYCGVSTEKEEENIQNLAIHDDWELQRLAYWNYIKERSNTIGKNGEVLE